MIRLEVSPLVRTLLLACILGASLGGCAQDGRLDLKKIDFSKLKQPDWIKWDRDRDKDKKAEPAKPAATAQTAAPAKTTPPAATSAPKRNLADATPRPKPWRQASVSNPVAARKQSGLAQPRHRQPTTPEKKEQVAKVPQGKVTSETPKPLAALPDAPARQGGKAAKGGYSPDDLVGLDGPSVERLLGKPDLSRKEPFAEVWQYTHGDCVLFLFIYAQEGSAGRVSHAETGARDGGINPEPGKCVGAILARHAQTPG